MAGRISRFRKLRLAFLIFLLLAGIAMTTNHLTLHTFQSRATHVFTLRSLMGSSGLDVVDRMLENFYLEGAIFGRNGPVKKLNESIQVSIVHSYSPYTENHFREMMVDPVRGEHRIYANSPAILQLESGEIITVMRIWLEKEIWGMTKNSPHNTFSDNYFYIQRFDRQMRPITDGRILGIVTPIQWTVGDGPIEPRIFKVNDTIYLTFNTGIFTKTRTSLDSTFIWDLTNNRALIPRISGGQPMLEKSEGGMPRDKHWSAIVNDTRLYFTYNLDPLRVIDCSVETSKMGCKFVHKEGSDSYTFRDTRDALRGGTPFVLYKYPYYISVAHGTYFRACPGSKSRCHGRRYYTTHLILITIEPDFKIIYVSGNIPFPKKSLDLPLVRYRFIENSFFFPVGLILENHNSLVLGGHINDHSSVLYRIANISSTIDKAIEYNSLGVSLPGPAPGVLQNYTRQMAEKFSRMKFQTGE